MKVCTKWRNTIQSLVKLSLRTELLSPVDSARLDLQPMTYRSSRQLKLLAGVSSANNSPAFKSSSCPLVVLYLKKVPPNT